MIPRNIAGRLNPICSVAQSSKMVCRLVILSVIDTADVHGTRARIRRKPRRETMEADRRVGRKSRYTDMCAGIEGAAVRKAIAPSRRVTTGRPRANEIRRVISVITGLILDKSRTNPPPRDPRRARRFECYSRTVAPACAALHPTAPFCTLSFVIFRPAFVSFAAVTPRGKITSVSYASE